MLVLSRRNGEAVVVGGGGLGRVVKVTVLQIASGRVRLGFDVGGDITVHREEVWRRQSANGELQVRTDYVRPT